MGNKKRDKQRSELANQSVDMTQVQQQVEQYHQVAQAIRSSITPAQVETALAPINELPEATQVAFLKALTKEGTLDAADLLQAVNAFAAAKETRKAARRALIQLEEIHLYPHWKPPATPSPVAEPDIDLSIPARFWQALYTDSRETGQMQLMLFFEQGRNYQDVRMMGFLLEFWHDGVKDFFTRVISKRQAEDQITHMRSQLADISLANCTLEEGRRLLEEALATNKRAGTVPHPDYRRNLPLIQHLVLHPAAADEAFEDSEDDELEEDEESFDPYASLSSLLAEVFAMSEAGGLTTSILEDWVGGDYAAFYDQLASDSPLRDGLARDEWIARRRAWSAEANPTNYRQTFMRERAADDDEAPIIVDAGWSFECTDTPLSGDLKELPVATAVSQETRRHWFWSSYTFIEEDGELRLQSITDEGTALRNLSVEELKGHLDEIAELAADRLEQLREEAEEEYEDDEDEDIEDEDEDEDIDEDEDEEDDEDEDEDLEFGNMANRLQEALQVTTTALHYADALIAQAPLDSPEVYNTAFDQAEILQDHERAAVYMQRQMEHFPDLRADALQKLAIVHFAMSEAYNEEEDEEQQQRFFELAEKDLRASLALKKTPFGSVMLAQTLIARGKQFDEAEELLHQAQEFETSPRETTLIEVGLAMLAQNKEDDAQALLHYQRAADISPDFPGVWVSLGLLQRKLEQYEAAEQSFLRAIEENPEQPEAYVNLAAIYMDQQHDLAKALEILEEGLEENPDAAELMAYLSIVHLQNKDLQNAYAYLVDAENTDPELEIVQVARQRYNAEKTAQRQSPKQKSKQHKPKKKR